MAKFPLAELASGEKAFGTSDGRAYDAGQEVFWALVLNSAFLDPGDEIGGGIGDPGSFPEPGPGGLSPGTGAGSGRVGSGASIAWPSSANGPAPGDKICMDVRASTKNGAWLFYWGLSDLDNLYYTRVDFDAETLDWGLVSGGTTSQIAGPVDVSPLDSYGGIGAPDVGTAPDPALSLTSEGTFDTPYNQAKGVHLNPSGDTMYVSDTNNGQIHQYTLSTPYDVTTASLDYSHSFPSSNDSPDSVRIVNDGTLMVASEYDGSNAVVYDWPLSTPYDISTAGARNSNSFNRDNFGTARGIDITSDGVHLYTTGTNSSFDTVLGHWELSTPWDFSTATHQESVVPSFANNDGSGIIVNSDGSKLLVTTRAPACRLYEIELSTPHDLTTLSVTDNVAPSGVNLADDLYLAGEVDDLYIADGDLGYIDQFSIDVGGFVPKYSVSGTVTDSDANPVEGATVTDGAGNSATTDANGDYSGSFDQSATELYAGKDGENIDVVPVTLSGNDTVNFTLPAVEDVTYNLEMRWYTNGKIDAELFDTDGTTSMGVAGPTKDSTFSSGGYGYEFTNAGLYAADTIKCGTVSFSGDVTGIDDFEDADLSEYQGDTGTATVQSTTVDGGSYALDTDSAGTFVYSTSGLPDYPAQGDVFESRMYLTSASSTTTVADMESSIPATLSSDWSQSSTQAYAGTYSAYYANSTGPDSLNNSYIGFSATSAPTHRFYAYFPTYANGHGGASLFKLRNGADSSTVKQIGWKTDGSFVLGGGQTDTGVDLPTGVWCEYQFDLDFGANQLDITITNTDTSSVLYDGNNIAFDNNANDVGQWESAMNTDAEAYFDQFEYEGSPTVDAGHFAFGVQDASNYYYVDVDAGAGTLQLREVIGGTDSLVAETTGLTIPTGEFLRVEPEWQANDNVNVTLYDSADAEVGTVSGTVTGGWTTGGVGFGE